MGHHCNWGVDGICLFTTLLLLLIPSLFQGQSCHVTTRRTESFGNQVTWYSSCWWKVVNTDFLQGLLFQRCLESSDPWRSDYSVYKIQKEKQISSIKISTLVSWLIIQLLIGREKMKYWPSKGSRQCSQIFISFFCINFLVFLHEAEWLNYRLLFFHKG